MVLFRRVTLFSLLFITVVVSAGADGPYLFYKNGGVSVESVVYGSVQREQFSSNNNLTIQCKVGSPAVTFDVPIRTSHTGAESYYELPSKIVAVSDIEGNFKGLTNLLKSAGIVDSNLNWIFGDGHFVLIGDVFDRGDYVTECLWLLYKLEAEAKAAGGEVHMLIGNHEFMCLTGDYRYVEPKYDDVVSLLGVREYKDLYGSDTELGRWLRTKNSIVKIGKYIFNHAGISPELASSGLSIPDMNLIVQKKIDGIDGPNTELVTDKSGCFWYRGYVKAVSPYYVKASSSDVSQILNTFDASRFFVGHCKLDGIDMMYGGKVIGIDVRSNHGDPYFHAFMYEDGVGYDYNTRTARRTELFRDEVIVTTPQYKLTTVAENGRIILNPEGGVYDSGTVVELSYRENGSNYFTGWGGDTSSFDNNLTFTMDSPRTIAAFFHARELTVDPEYGIAGGNRAKDEQLQATFYGHAYDGASIDTNGMASADGMSVTYSIPAQSDPNLWPGAEVASYVSQHLEDVSHIRVTYISDESLYLKLSDSTSAPWVTLLDPTDQLITVDISVDSFSQPTDWGLPTGEYNPSELMTVSVSPAQGDYSTAMSGAFQIGELYLVGVKQDIQTEISTYIENSSVNFVMVNKEKMVINSIVGDAVTVDIFTASGRVVYQTNRVAHSDRVVLGIPNLGSGVHFVRVKNSIGTETVPLIVQ
ncbi:MAG: T9SS type A sorting domain-containing protein [Candidatus Scalindua sp.]|nr:T9SS type A sorting domain-containing protein [Candidatus Scalindua sp.]